MGTAVKKWQNYSAFSKVKAEIERLSAAAAADLEAMLEDSGAVADGSDRLAACEARLEQIAGVLRAMECGELALLADEMLGLARDALDPRVEAEAAQLDEAKELLYVAVCDFPAVMEGVLCGRLRRWQEYSLLFNRIRKARNRALVFSSQTLLARREVDFGRLAVSNPGKMAELAGRQLALYDRARKQVLQNVEYKNGMESLRRVFCNLEILYRDFRLGTLFGLCSSLAEALPVEHGDRSEAEDAALKLLCSFSRVMAQVAKQGGRLLNQNIPESILEQVINVAADVKGDSERLKAVKYWYNLDLALGREYRRRYTSLTVDYSRKGACVKAIRLLAVDINLMSEDINREIADRSGGEEGKRQILEGLRRLEGAIVALAIPAAAVPLRECLARLDAESDEAALLQAAARSLCQCELLLLARAEEMERSVFASAAAGDGGKTVSGARLNVVLEAIKNLEKVVIVVNNYVDGGRASSGMREAVSLLAGAERALATVPLKKAAAYAGAAGGYAAAIAEGGRTPGEDSFQAFTHLLLNCILYLEQVTIGRAADLGPVLRESDALLRKVEAGTGSVEDDEPGGQDRSPAGQAPTTSDAPRMQVEEMQQTPASPEVTQKQVEALLEPALQAKEPVPVPAPPDVDDEIKNIFLEEAAEILEAIDEQLAALGSRADDEEALVELRRAFHTLKGSGRMVGAGAIGELAWRVENLLNNVIAGKLAPGARLLDLIRDVRTCLPELIESFRKAEASAFDSASVADMAARVDDCINTQQAAEAEGDAREQAGDQPEQDDGAGPAEGRTENNTVAEDFVLEAERQLRVIRELLDRAGELNEGAQSVFTTDFLIPVHTLYGNCGVAELHEFGRAAGGLERFLQDHPYLRLNPALSRLLEGFCGLAGKLVSLAGNGEIGTAQETLGDELRAFMAALAEVSGSLQSPAGQAPTTFDEPQRQADEPQTQTDNQQKRAHVLLEPAPGLLSAGAGPQAIEPEPPAAEDTAQDDDSLVLQAFLQEARTTNALLLKLFDDFRGRPADGELIQQLQEQLDLLEGAAFLARQDGVAELSRALALAYRRDVEATEVGESVLARLEKCHRCLADSLARLEAGDEAPEVAPLLEGLRMQADQQQANREQAALEADEEQAEGALLEVFLEEAEELLREVDSDLAEWQQEPHEGELMDRLLRLLHTLKGSSALIGETSMSTYAHDFESLVIQTRSSPNPPDREFFRQADRYLSVLQTIYARYRRDGDGKVAREPLDEEALEALVRGEKKSPLSTEADGAAPEAAAVLKPQAPPQPEDAAVPMAAPATEAVERQLFQDEQVRVSARLLKSLLNDADEISIAQNRMEQNMSEFGILLGDMDETLGRLQSYIRSFEKQARPGQPQVLRTAAGGPAAQNDFDALEMDRYTELQQISLSLLEDYDDLRDIKRNLDAKVRGIDSILADQQRSANKLQDGLISSQMVPFSGIVPRLRRLTRQVSEELDKQVAIRFSNPEGKIDRNVLQAIVTPLEHMIRNAVDHGIEPLEERRRAGKSELAEIHVRLYRQGAAVILDVSDDGRGINVAGIRRRAVDQGLLAPDAEISDQEAYQFILRAGFSTSENLSRISGRGVGLDVVCNEIHQIGGDIEILSAAGQGTTFRMRLPLTSSLNRTLLFSVGGADYVVLLNTIDGIVLEKVANLRNYYGEDQATLLQYGNKSYQLAYMGALLDESAVPAFADDQDSAPVLLVSGKDRNVALQVDAITGSRNLVVKSLGTQFAALAGIAGGVILGDGRVAVVIDPVSLVDSHPASAGTRFEQVLEAETAPLRDAGDGSITVLVVDDSITVRKVTSTILKRHGMNVLLAKNGMEAVEILQNRRPDIMLLDIEMPKMDGFEVAAYIRRQQGAVKDLPIIMITSRIGDKHRSRAEEIGVNQYMCKPFQEENLLAAISDFN